MATKWTPEQLKVIDNRDKNILVSAAAGSGKTAVLVERIISMVTDKESPIDIDKLLIVTFTNAAAAEMRERILKALIKAHREEPDNEHLQKQMTYINNAMITTIDSFCLNVVKDNFSRISIDPGFRIGDNDELQLIKSDILDEILEKHYEEGNEDFLNCMQEYVSKQGVSSIEAIVLKLYEEAGSYPNPIEFINSLRDNYMEVDEEKVGKAKWFQVILSDIKDKLIDNLEALKIARKACLEENGPLAYEGTIQLDIQFLTEVLKQEDFSHYQKLFLDYNIPSLPRISKKDNVDDERKAFVQGIRDEFKKNVKKYKEAYFINGLSESIKIINKCSNTVNVILDLVIEFIEEYGKRKREENLVDFSDLEHFAYDILWDKCDGEEVPSEVAKQLSENFYEILIDEYQDSNYIQEGLLTAVSRKHRGDNNIFMVGDVKQSIYGFRQAKPELFLEKYNTYETDSDSHMKICLSKNFRSRTEILDFTNLIFRQIMIKELGGITYDSESALYYGASYETIDGNDTEVLLINTNEEILDEDINDDDDESGTKYEIEATVIADRVLKLIEDSHMVTDKATGKLRKIEYKDIAILLRSTRGLGDTITKVFSERGIPIDCVISTGYFDTFEIVSVLNYLSVIDNPRQDIPLVSVLRNVYEFTESELAYIKGQNRWIYWDALKHYEGNLSDRVGRAVTDIEYFRKISTYTPIYELIDAVIKTTGFREFVLSMGNGQDRLNNIEMLMEKAVKYEGSSYKSLFNFIRYIEKIKKYEINTGMAPSENAVNSVKLMTIHKSKGLEYPVVICAGMGKLFNEAYLREKIIINSELGLGMDYVDIERNIRYKTLIKEAMKLKNKRENYAEELRVLYVALTRAKEKLILVGSGNVESILKKAIGAMNWGEEAYGAVTLLSCRSYIEWIMIALIRHRSMRHILNAKKIGAAIASPVYDDNSDVSVKIIEPSQIIYEAVKRVVINDKKTEALMAFDEDTVYDENIREELKKNLAYEYAYMEDIDLKAKVSVSDVKHSRMEELEEFRTEERLFTSDTPTAGAIRGTAYHRVLELLDYSMDIKTTRDIETMIADMIENGKISSETASYIDVNTIMAFVNSSLGKRMKTAFNEGKLFREKQFVMGINPRNVFTEYNGEELLLVQGIIDAMFEEDGEYVIVDYKTDSVSDINKLKDRYQVQLELYAKSVYNSTGKQVKELIIYSTKFKDELRLDFKEDLL